MRHATISLALFASVLPLRADACSVVLPPVAETAEHVAKVGFLIEGEVIQSFDPDKQQPEIIRAKTIFVGNGLPRDFVIYHSKAEFESAMAVSGKRSVKILACPESHPATKGERFERLVLLPANPSADASANGRWVIPLEGSSVAMGRGLDKMVEEATRHGRFRVRPPQSQKWGDCMECSASKSR